MKCIEDYYPFGSPMQTRTWSSEAYRFGFNGKEIDDEISGEGNQQDYGMRIYNPRLGKFLSVDPLFKDYPFYSPFHFAGNRPILCIDLDGAEPLIPLNTKSKCHIQKETSTTLLNKVENTKTTILVEKKDNEVPLIAKFFGITFSFVESVTKTETTTKEKVEELEGIGFVLHRTITTVEATVNLNISEATSATKKTTTSESFEKILNYDHKTKIAEVSTDPKDVSFRKPKTIIEDIKLEKFSTIDKFKLPEGLDDLAGKVRGAILKNYKTMAKISEKMSDIKD